MAAITSLAKAFGLGAGLMYWADPSSGRRRRMRARDRIIHWLRKAREAVAVVACDSANRIRGTAAALRSRLLDDAPSDAVLEQRIRSLLGRVVCRPHDVRVMVADRGHVKLLGKLTAPEADDFVRQVAAMRGVAEVESLLETPAKEPPAPATEGMRRRPDSAARIWLGAAGAAGAVMGLQRGGLTGAALALLGVGGLAAAATRVPARRLLGLGPAHGGIEVRKTIHIQAPPEVVYECWSKWENFPAFMSRVKDVSVLGAGRTRWTVAGPMGRDVAWDATVIATVPGERIVWESDPGSAVSHRGEVRFSRDGRGGTQTDICINYRPPAGLAGHVLAALCGCDPKSEMDEDLNRMKTFIETGHAPADAARKGGVTVASANRSRLAGDNRACAPDRPELGGGAVSALNALTELRTGTDSPEDR